MKKERGDRQLFKQRIRFVVGALAPSTSGFSGLKMRRFLGSLTWGIVVAATAVLPVKAAEKIYLIYNPLNFSLKVSSLETFAKEGIVNKDLAFYLSLPGITEEEKVQFREALLQRVEVDPLVVARFFYTDVGEDILDRIGKLINIQGGRNGKYAIRGAIIQAAFDPEGLTLLNFLKKLSINIQIDLEQSLELARIIEIVVKETLFFSEETAQLATQEAADSSRVDFAKLTDLRQLGNFNFEQQRWTLTDSSRQRTFYVDVYKPQQWRTDKTPVVIISHSLGSRPEDFANRAKYLASSGYVVAIPQHPGSDNQQIKDFLAGYSHQIFERNGFRDRPLDIRYTIDELERRNAREFEGRLDLNNVGVYGHSFGGYTALAVAGATWDLDYLKQECTSKFDWLNTSLLLQCRALKLENKSNNFRDERVKAVFVANPVNSSIFGPKGLSQIQIPVFIGAGNYDPATPFVFEQVRSFPWLKTPHKYLMLIEGQAHLDFSQLDAGITDMINSVTQVTLPSPQLIDSYADAVMLAFFEVYLAHNPDFLPYLQSSYLNYLSQGQEFKGYLITAASANKLNEEIQKFMEEDK